MNLHPIFIHFPIALFSLYTLCELARFQKIKNQPAWFYIKAVLVIFGSLGAIAAILAGDGAKEAVFSGLINPQVADPRAVIKLHETLAEIGTIIFVLPALAYAVVWLNKVNFINYLPGKFLQSIWKLGTQIQKIITDTALIVILPILGLAIITSAAALGGAIVYGPNTDPVVKFIYHLFFS